LNFYWFFIVLIFLLIIINIIIKIIFQGFHWLTKLIIYYIYIYILNYYDIDISIGFLFFILRIICWNFSLLWNIILWILMYIIWLIIKNCIIIIRWAILIFSVYPFICLGIIDKIINSIWNSSSIIFSANFKYFNI